MPNKRNRGPINMLSQAQGQMRMAHEKEAKDKSLAEAQADHDKAMEANPDQKKANEAIDNAVERDKQTAPTTPPLGDITTESGLTRQQLDDAHKRMDVEKTQAKAVEKAASTPTSPAEDRKKDTDAAVGNHARGDTVDPMKETKDIPNATQTRNFQEDNKSKHPTGKKFR